MIEEHARVIEAADGYAWVETQRRSSCDSCAVNAGCGTSVLGRVLGQKRTRVRVLDPLGTRGGDQVVIGIEDGALLRTSLAAYLVPLFGLLAGALGGQSAARAFGGPAEACSALAALAGLAAGIVWLLHHARRLRHDRRYQPVVLRRDFVIVQPR